VINIGLINFGVNKENQIIYLFIANVLYNTDALLETERIGS